MTDTDAIVRWIDRRLGRILDAPPSCGSPEAVETQVLLLLETRAFALRPDREPENPRAIVDAYLSFLSRRFPRRTLRPLFEMIGQDDDDYSKLADGLREFINEVRRETRKG